MKAKKRHKAALDLTTQLDYLFRKGVNLRNRIITISGEIEDGLFRLVDAAMSELEHRSDRPITIRINSQGGGVYEALAVTGRIRRSRCKVITEGYGAIMSAATLILAAGQTRRISKLAWFMHHETAYQISGAHSRVKAYVEQASREEAEWCRWMSEFTDTDLKFWKEIGRNKDTYFCAQELVKLGVADVLI